MVRDDPERADHVVGDLVVRETLLLQVVGHQLEAVLFHELLGQLVRLEQVHQTEGVGVDGQVQLAFLLEQPVEEDLGVLLAVLVLAGSRGSEGEGLLDEHGLDVGGEVSLVVGGLFVLDEEAVEEADEVLLLLLAVGPLDGHQVLNSSPIVFKDAIYQKQGKSDNFGVTFHLFDDIKEQSEISFSFVFLEDD